MKEIFTIVLVMVILAFSSFVGAISSFALLKGPKGQLVLILGDSHSDIHSKYIPRFLVPLQAANLEKPLKITLEIPDGYSPSLQKCFSPNIVSIFDFAKQSKELSIEAFEPRGDMSDSIELFRQLIELELRSEDLEENLFSWERWKRIRPKDKTTVGKYRNYLADNLSKLKALGAKLEREASDIFNCSVIEVYEKAYQAILDELAEKKEGALLWNAIASKFTGWSNKEELLDYYNDWFTSYLLGTDYLFFEGMLFGKLMSRSVTSTEPECLLIGNFHAKALFELLISLPEWSRVERGSLASSNACQQTAFSSGLQRSVSKLLAPLRGPRSVKPHCVVCKKTGELMQCPCRKVKYCGPKCQKADWKAHKKVCSKAKLKAW